jgi:hypothetical protein
MKLLDGVPPFRETKAGGELVDGDGRAQSAAANGQFISVLPPPPMAAGETRDGGKTSFPQGNPDPFQTSNAGFVAWRSPEAHDQIRNST